MGKVIWMSDLHFAAAGLVAGYDPRARLRAAVDHINAHSSDADLCVISGDLVDHATEDNYAALKRALDQMAIPYLPMVGNHDDRALLCKAFGIVGDGDGFVQLAATVAGMRVLCLDSISPGQVAGSFCAARLDWLSGQLVQHPQVPTLVFMHHPPMRLGLPMQDVDRLLQAEDLVEVLSAAPQVKHLFWGHVHRPIVGNLRGKPFATMRAVLMQAPPPKPDWDWDSFAPVEEAPAIGVIDVNGGDVVVQYIEFGA